MYETPNKWRIAPACSAGFSWDQTSGVSVQFLHSKPGVYVCTMKIMRFTYPMETEDVKIPMLVSYKQRCILLGGKPCKETSTSVFAFEFQKN
jgi:hypothetical protein